MTPYLAVARARFRLLFQYRTVALAGVCTQLFWGWLRVMIFVAFYAHTSFAMPMTLPQVITYSWLIQVFLALLPWNIEREVEQMVRNGNVAYELVRPVNLYWLWYARALAWRLAPTLMRMLPVALIAWLFLGLQPPSSVTSAALFGFSITLALFLSTSVTVLLMTSLFWTVSSNGIVKIMTALIFLFSGMQVPLPLFPGWSQPIISLLPFRGLADTPFRLYLGHIKPEDALGPLIHQVVWTLLLVAFGGWLIARASRRVAIQGG